MADNLTRFSDPITVDLENETREQKKRRLAVVYAFDQAAVGNMKPGIDLGIFTDPNDAEESEE